jgi:hypothetical protein
MFGKSDQSRDDRCELHGIRCGATASECKIVDDSAVMVPGESVGSL